MIGLDYSWIKLPRSFCDWRWYKDSHMVLLYLHILLHASFSDKEIGEVVIKRGQMLTSYAQLCNNTGLSLQTVRTCIKKLLKTKQIKVLSCKHHTTISVVAYDSFQPEGKDELNPNWIKLYRKIEDWRWYKDALTFHLFIHLLLTVNFCPSANGENILGRGQIMVTRRSLTESTNISDRSIRTCIEKLQKSKEILISQKATNRPHIITICNYDSYQSGFAPSNIQLTYNQHTTNIQCESVQQALVFASKSDQPNLDVNACGAMGYIDNDTLTNTQLTYNQHTANTQLTHDQQTDNIQVTTYKNIRNKEIKKNISSTSARAREVENFEVLETDPEVYPLMAPFMTAKKNNAMEQLEGMIGTLRVQTSRLATKEAYWVFSGDDFDLKVSDPKNPSYLLIANDPEMESIIGALNALILNRLVTRVNSGQGKNVPVSIIVDELPTLYFHKIDRLIGTARSNKVAVTLGFQELPQLEADYGKVGKDKIITTVGNVISGSARSKDTLDWLSGDIFGKVVQLKKGITIDRDRTSINLNENLDSLVPASKISDMASGWICGQTARDFTVTKTGRKGAMDIQKAEEFKTSKFFCKTNFNMDEIKAEEEDYKNFPLPKFYDFGSVDAKERILYNNFNKIDQEVKNMIKVIQREFHQTEKTQQQKAS